MKARTGRNPIFWIVLTAPLALLLLCQLQPTFDDWTYYTVPQTEPLTLQNLLPDGNCFLGIFSDLITDCFQP